MLVFSEFEELKMCNSHYFSDKFRVFLSQIKQKTEKSA